MISIFSIWLFYGKHVDQCFLGFDDKTEYVTSGDAVIMDV